MNPVSFLHCDDNADCDQGKVCCLTVGPTDNSACSAACDGSVMCDPNADGCVPPTQCQPFDVKGAEAGYYSTCQ